MEKSVILEGPESFAFDTSNNNKMNEVIIKRKNKFCGFTTRQWKFLGAFGVTNIFRAAAALANAPFFSALAREKGLNGTTTGLLFGVYALIQLFVLPIYGNYIIPRFGAKLVCVFCSSSLGVFYIVYGMLYFVEDQTTFIALCFLIRLIGGGLDAGFYPSVFTMFTVESPKYVSTCIGIFEVFFGLGAVLGPPVAGALIDNTSFAAIFAGLGVLIILFGILSYLIVPKPKETSDFEFIKADWKRIWSLIKLPKSCVIFCHHLTCAISIGYLVGTFEKHIREQFELSSFHVGLIFAISTFLYMMSSPFWGLVVDKKKDYKLPIVSGGIFLIFLGFSLVGPLPFFGSEASLWVILTGYGIHGIGAGCSIMATYPIALDAALERKFSDNVQTYSAISCIYSLMFSLGFCIGPVMGGFLFDHVGFRMGSFSIVTMTIFIAGIQFIAFWPKKEKSGDIL